MNDVAQTHESGDREARLELVLAEYLRAVETGRSCDQQALVEQHPDLAVDLLSFFSNRAALERLARPLQGAAYDLTLGLPGGGNVNHPTSVRYFGDYELLEELARGGMGVVYRARQTSLNRIVAVKMILSGQLADDSAVRRFRQEAEAAAKLDHPHIVQVFEVGEHQGQHYFSMGLVEGQSLAAKLAAGPLAPREAAALMEQVARAVQYAHEHGVIHRDLKPANVLLDREGRPRVTDFGLAKITSREQSLTSTGQALGTPGYMPPEQVEGNDVGPAADVYGLGAILYALVTGRPPFQAATAMETMLQVCAADPVPPRQLNPSVPRDLDTIVRKCLEKWPTWRYASAAELANELARFLAGEPIQARRPGLVEQGVRWYRKQRRSVALAVAAVAATLLLTVAGASAWFWYQDWRLGRVRFKTDHPPIVAELTGAGDTLATPLFTIPVQEPVALPADEYKLRVSQPGRFSQSYQMTIPRGLYPAEYSLNLDDQLMAAASGSTELHVKQKFGLVRRQRRADVILFDAKGLHRPAWPGTGEAWSVSFDKPANYPELAALPGFRWPWADLSGYQAESDMTYRPHLVEDAPDLNGDQIEDVILAARHQAWLLAASGSDGKILWFAARGEDVGLDPKVTHPYSFSRRNSSAVLGKPVVAGDLNRDGVPELLVNLADERGNRADDANLTAEPAVRRMLDCIDGKTGKSLWQVDFDHAWFQLPQGVEIPHEAQWMVEVNGRGSGGGSYSDDHGEVSRNMGSDHAYGVIRQAAYPPVVATIDQQTIAVCAAGSRLVCVDLTTGKPAWEPVDMGRPAVRIPQLADLDGDGQTELLIVQQVPNQQASANATQQSEELDVSAWPLAAEARPRWTHKINAQRQPPWKLWSPTRDWPVIADLDRDGRPEIVLPNRTWDPIRYRWLKEVEVVDGATGQSRWLRMLKMMDPQIDEFLVGPDIDGDGRCEVVAATLVGNRYDLYVDVLSGKDGHTLHWGSHRLGESSYLVGIALWHPATDGWPQVLVHTAPQYSHDGTTGLFAFSLGSGKLQGTVGEVGEFRLADGDGDGLSDLFALKFANRNEPIAGGQLHALHGVNNESWRRLGGMWQAGADYDGDGMSDLVAVFPAGLPEIAAISGADGRKLWRRTIELGTSTWNPLIKPLAQDLNGDGACDLIVHHSTQNGSAAAGQVKFPVAAISGKSGETLWQVEQLFTNIECVLFLEVADLEHDNSPEVVFSTFTDWDFPRGSHVGYSSANAQHWLAVVDGRSGKFRWRQPLSIQYGYISGGGQPTAHNDQPRGADVHPVYADVSGDGVFDVIMPAEVPNTPGQFELRALSGTDGKVLWHRPYASDVDVRNIWQEMAPPVAADLDGDGKVEIVGLEYFWNNPPNSAQKRMARVFALEGASGRTKWKWECEVEHHCGASGDDPGRQAARPRPLVLRRKGKTPVVAVGLWGWSKPGRIVALDSAGRLIAEHAVAVSPLNSFTLRACDLRGTGEDDLLLLESDLLSTLGIRPQDDGTAEELKTLWKWPFPAGSPQLLIGIVDRAKSSPTFVVQSRTNLYGIDAATGRNVWINRAPHPDNGAGMAGWFDTRLLTLADRSAPPHAVFQWRDLNACRAPAMIGGSDLPLTPVKAAPVASIAFDPRMQRPIWWAQDRDRSRDVRRVFWSLCLATFLVVLPGRTLLGIVRRRQFDLKTMLLIPVLVGFMFVMLTAPSMVGDRGLYDTWPYRLEYALWYTPPIICVGVLIQLARQGRWRWLFGSLVVSLLIAVGIAVFAYTITARHLNPGERYFVSDLDIPIAMGFYALSLIVIMVTVAISLFTWARRRASLRPAGVKPVG